MAKSPQMKLRQIADDLAKAQCRSRGVCEVAGLDSLECKGVLQWAHIVERSNMAIRWAPLNCLCLCQAHHLLYTYRPVRWTLLIEKHFKKQWRYIKLHINDKFDGDYMRVIEELKEQG